ncbi:MAG: hypothetical protein Q9172_003928 [Xanthocarpia lactea]
MFGTLVLTGFISTFWSPILLTKTAESDICLHLRTQTSSALVGFPDVLDFPVLRALDGIFFNHLPISAGPADEAPIAGDNLREAYGPGRADELPSARFIDLALEEAPISSHARGARRSLLPQASWTPKETQAVQDLPPAEVPKQD